MTNEIRTYIVQQVSADADGTRATVHYAKSTIVLYTELHAECDQQYAIGRRTSAVNPAPPGAVNTIPTAVAVYIALADGRRAVATFSRSKVWDKVPEGSTLIFLDTLISLS